MKLFIKIIKSLIYTFGVFDFYLFPDITGLIVMFLAFILGGLFEEGSLLPSKVNQEKQE